MKNYKIDSEGIAVGKSFSAGKKLDKLGQTGTTANSKPRLRISGLGSDISDNNTLMLRTKRKLVTQKIVLALVEIAKKKENAVMARAFRNTYYCLNKIVVSDNRLFGKYCKCRHCTLCNSIRKAEMINKLFPVIQEWEEPYFVTLTVKSCYAKHLNLRMQKMIQGFKILRERLKKRHQRGTGPKFMGIKSLECNFNPERRTYNPHFHLIVPSKELAILLIDEWLKLWTPSFTHRFAQHFRKVENVNRDLIETIKYGSKIFTEPNPGNKSQKMTRKVYVAALYNIYNAMSGLRLFERFGFNLPETNGKDANYSVLDYYEELLYCPQVADWINEDTGETLTGYVPEAELQNLLGERIDSKLE